MADIDSSVVGVVSLDEEYLSVEVGSLHYEDSVGVGAGGQVGCLFGTGTVDTGEQIHVVEILDCCGTVDDSVGHHLLEHRAGEDNRFAHTALLSPLARLK